MKKQAKRKDVTPSIPEELNFMLGSLKALATTHHLLRTGGFSFEYRDAVASSIQYIEALHKQVWSEAKSHPESHLVPMFQKMKTPEDQVAQDKAFAQVLEEVTTKAGEH